MWVGFYFIIFFSVNNMVFNFQHSAMLVQCNDETTRKIRDNFTLTLSTTRCRNRKFSSLFVSYIKIISSVKETTIKTDYNLVKLPERQKEMCVQCGRPRPTIKKTGMDDSRSAILWSAETSYRVKWMGFGHLLIGLL